MYEELIEKLRCCVEQIRCGDCRYVKDCNGDRMMMSEAADTIEELRKAVLRLEDESGIYDELPTFYIYPTKWIPVTERLPEEYTDVLCYYEYFRYGDYNCMFRTIDRGYYGNGRWGGEAGQGHKNKVLAWMPLPEPPKEET